jgi:putative phage-type endonuclease
VTFTTPTSRPEPVTHAAVEVLPWNAPRAAWLAARREGVGSSDIAAILGLSAWESQFGLWHRKFGDLGDQEDSDAMRWGRRLEDAVAAEYAYLHPELEVHRVGLCRNQERPWQQCTPDRLVYDGDTPVFPLEIKTDGSYDGWGHDGSDEIPVGYRAQALWQLDTLGFERITVAVLISGRTYREYEIAYHPGDVATMRAAAQRFLGRTVPPPIDDSTATATALKSVNPLLEPSNVEINQTLASLYERAVRSAVAAEKRKMLATNRLRAALGNGKYAVHAGKKYAVRSVYDADRLDVTRLRREHPDIAEQYRVSGTTDKITPARGLTE